MNSEGPPLETLLRRIAETPPDFLAGPSAAALAHDVLRRAGRSVPPNALAPLRATAEKKRERLAVAALLTWLLDEPSLAALALDPEAIVALLVEGASGLGDAAHARQYVEDPERREELARVTLARLGLRPAGETIAQAEDRLTGVSGAERKRVIIAARAAEARARKIREQLAAKAAAESADKWTRE